MKLNKFDIVLVNFPYTDLSETKKKPALLIKTLEDENDILCQITTKRRKFRNFEVQLNKNQCEGNIKFNSYIYLDIIAALHKSQIVHKIGKINDENIKKQINSKLNNLFCT